MNNELRVTSHESQGTNRAFTLIELVVAVAILAMVLSFAGVIFKVSIGAYRTTMANTEIMQKLRAITDQLNGDFEGLQKDGYLMLHSEVQARSEYQDSDPCNFRADRLYYFSTGDFQSWFAPNIRSNIARVYFGHDSISLYLAIDRPVSEWNLARDIVLLTPGVTPPPPPLVVDYNDISYAECKAALGSFEDPNIPLNSPVTIDTGVPDSLRNLLCQNAGAMQIQWTDGTTYPDGSLIWVGGTTTWTPSIQQQYWPKALKFTFTLYDSKRTLKGGRTFTHIVYIGD